MARPNPLRVLVVEDNPADAWTVREALESRGSFETTCVDRLGDAVGRLGDADVVVLDLGLPDGRGVESVDRIRAEAPRLPVVVLSGVRDEDTAFRCLQHGAQDVLVKGTSGGEALARAVLCALERQALAAERDEALRRARIAKEAERRAEEGRREDEGQEAVERLAGGVAQGLRNQLTLILGHSWLLMASAGDAAKARSHARHIHAAAREASHLVDRLLACTGRQRVLPELLDPSETVGALRGRLEALLRPDQRLQEDLAPRPGWVRADRRLLELAVKILLEHARDATPEGGRIRLATILLPPAAEAPDRRRVAIEVTDGGPGMDAGARGHLFEPFYTTEVLGIGTGPGLAPVLGIARHLAGEVAVAGGLGEGTAIRMILPLVEEGPRAARGPGPAANFARPEDLPGGTETVLLADRDPAIRWLLGTCLEGLGYRVLRARDAGDAVRIADAEPGALDLLLVEAELPGAAGPLLVRLLRSHRPDLAVLLLVDPALPSAGVRVRPPPEACLRKPFGWGDLALAVRAVLDTRPPPPVAA